MIIGSRRPRLAPWQAGFSMRRDWPAWRTHEFVGFFETAAEAVRFAESDRAYWRRGHVRPMHSVIVISQREFELHYRRHDCRSPDCPEALPGGLAVAVGAGIG